jgi:hypothetical protein
LLIFPPTPQYVTFSSLPSLQLEHPPSMHALHFPSFFLCPFLLVIPSLLFSPSLLQTPHCTLLLAIAYLLEYLTHTTSSRPPGRQEEAPSYEHMPIVSSTKLEPSPLVHTWRAPRPARGLLARASMARIHVDEYVIEIIAFVFGSIGIVHMCYIVSSFYIYAHSQARI